MSDRDEESEYRMLADHVIGLTNPPDDDAQDEVVLCMNAVSLLAKVVRGIKCTCNPADFKEHGMDAACDRCKALGRFANIEVSR
jgi:hypothetical protein